MRKIKEQYRQPFGKQYTLDYGRPIGWAMFLSAFEKIAFPTALVIMLILRMWEALAVTLVADYPVLILDEPTNDLDPSARRMVWDLLLKLRSEGRTIILVTHDVLEAERVIERLGLINKGRLMALGRTSELRARIDERVRLELTLHDHHGHMDLSEIVGEHAQVLSQDGERTLMLLPRDRVHAALTAVADRLGTKGLRDMRVSGPTLEDVYLQLGGSDRLD